MVQARNSSEFNKVLLDNSELSIACKKKNPKNLTSNKNNLTSDLIFIEPACREPGSLGYMASRHEEGACRNCCHLARDHPVFDTDVKSATLDRRRLQYQSKTHWALPLVFNLSLLSLVQVSLTLFIALGSMARPVPSVHIYNCNMLSMQ